VIFGRVTRHDAFSESPLRCAKRSISLFHS
jgi:hypothetical protein